MTIDTLKQAAQALQRAKYAHDFAEMKRPGFGHAQDAKLCGELAAALEAMVEQEPAGWRHSHTLCLYETEEEVPLADADEWAEPLYTDPIATREHDAKVRDAALEEAAKVCEDGAAESADHRVEFACDILSDRIRDLKSTGADHDN